MGWPILESFRGVSEGNMTRYAYPKPEPLIVEHECFRAAIMGKGADIISFDEGALTVRVAGAALEAAQTGTTVACLLPAENGR